VELQQTAQLHHRDGGSHPPQSIPSPQTAKIHSFQLYCSPPVIPSLNYQRRPAFLGEGRREIHSFAIAFALHVWNNSATPAKQLLFHSHRASFFQSPKPSPWGGGRGLDPSPALRLHKEDSGTYPFVRRFEGAQPFSKITSLPCVLTFWKTQPQPFQTARKKLQAWVLFCGSGEFIFSRAAFSRMALPEKATCLGAFSISSALGNLETLGQRVSHL